MPAHSIEWKALLCLVVAAACGKDTGAPVETPPDPGRMHVQISGAVQLTGEWNAFGEFRDLLASANDLSLMGGQNPQPATGDSNFTLVFPGRLDIGQFAIGRYVPGVVPVGPAAYVIFDSTFYASLPGGTLAVDSSGYPVRPGLTLGGLRGTLTFKAVGLVSGDTITVHATFDSHWYHYIYPNVSVTLNGDGPVTGTSAFSTAFSADDDHGGRLVEWESDFGSTHLFPHDISQELRVLAPSVGTFTLAATTPTQFATPAQWPAIYTALFYRDDPRLALSTGGTLTVTQFVAPTDDFYGEIHGTLTSRLALWTNATTLSGDSVDENITFAVQLWPLGGIPASSPMSPSGLVPLPSRPFRAR